MDASDATVVVMMFTVGDIVDGIVFFEKKIDVYPTTLC